VKKEDVITKFNAANDAIGTMILKFDSQEELNHIMLNQASWLSIVVIN
jgi:hypothetical protein